MTDKQRILVVDDEKQLCENVRKILSGQNIEVEQAYSAPEALEKMARERFSLLLSDMVMPEMNGLELLKRVKESWPLTRALIMTAYASTDTAVKAMQLGALDYITKPFTPDELRDIVNKAVNDELTEAATPEPVKKRVHKIGVDMPFDADEVAKYTGEDYVDKLGRSDMPVVEVNKPEGYCEMGQMVCDIFKKLGKTCKAGMKNQECPQKKKAAKEGKTGKKSQQSEVKKLIGIDMPFNYEEVESLTGPEYVRNLDSDGFAFLPYEELKARMAESGSAQTGSPDINIDMRPAEAESGQAEAPEVEVTASENLENYCEVGQMVCDIFKKLGKTCKAGTKKQECPQLKAKKGKAAESGRQGPAVKTLIGVDMPFDFEEVASLTGPEYAANIGLNNFGIPPYEELKADVQQQMAEKQDESESRVIAFPRKKAGPEILVIDDEAYISNNVQKILGKRGYSVDRAVTKQEALAQISEKTYEVVLLDLKIPGVQGMELLKEIRTQQPEARVIIITGYASIENAKESARLGIFDYLQKPFTPDEIRNTTENALTLAA
ncbi:MAG: response regulator [Desulfobacterales bacterium]